MILVIRIAGLTQIKSSLESMLQRLRLRRKYSAVLIKDTEENMKLLNRVRNFVAYGKIDSETMALLLQSRAKPLKGKKVEVSSLAKEIEKEGLSNSGIKPFFRLHPPRGGIDSKVHFPKGKGVLGDNKEKINELVRRML